MSSTQGKQHKTPTRSTAKSFDRDVLTEVSQGDQAVIEAYLETLAIGQYTSKKNGFMITGASSRRLQGGKVCEATVQSTKFKKKAIWGFDFHALSKPTITFRYPGEDDATVNLRAKCIRGWEALRDANRLPEYLDFKYIKYDENNEEIGLGSLDDAVAGGANTLKIAKKILRGQETYTVYYPVITVTRTSDEPFTDDLTSIGKQCTPSLKSSGWTPHGNPQQALAFLSLKAYWVKTADNIITNADGSFTRREQWTGMDDLDADFYPLV